MQLHEVKWTTQDQLENHLHHVEIYGSLFLTLVHNDAFYFFLSVQFVQANTQMTPKCNFMKWIGVPKDQLENNLHHAEIYGSLFLTLAHIDAFYIFFPISKGRNKTDL